MVEVYVTVAVLSGDLFQTSIKVRPVYYVAGMFGIKE